MAKFSCKGGAQLSFLTLSENQEIYAIIRHVFVIGSWHWVLVFCKKSGYHDYITAEQLFSHVAYGSAKQFDNYKQ